MSEKIDSTFVTRLSIPFLLVLLAALSGCAGMFESSSDPEPDRAVTGGYQGSETLAVLLPQSGRFAGAAQVVRDGIVAANNADREGERPELRFYDSAAGPITKLAQKAATDGAHLAIGPLQKQAVDKLAGSTELPLPTLALNQTFTAVKSSNLYRFSLAPEGEAADVADKAWAEGHRKALILHPKDKWGDRISRAFQHKWKAHGGTLVATWPFNPATANLSGMAAKLSAKAADADFMFLVATSKQARRIWPRLRDALGDKLRVYATSHVYDGRFEPQKDKDLVGLNFVEIPWLVESSKDAKDDTVSSAGLSKKLPRLYAMGVDAYRLGSRLDGMSANPQVRIHGKTGVLRMDPRRRIHRQLTLVRIEDTGLARLTPGGGASAEEETQVSWWNRLF